MSVHSKSGVSVSPDSVELLQLSSVGLQSQMLWRLLLPMQDPQAGETGLELRTRTSAGELL